MNAIYTASLCMLVFGVALGSFGTKPESPIIGGMFISVAFVGWCIARAMKVLKEKP